MASLLQTKLTPDLRRQLQVDPTETVDLLLRVSEASDPIQAQIEAVGFQVRRRLILVPTFAVTGRIDALLDLLAHPWLISGERDRPVTIMTN